MASAVWTASAALELRVPNQPGSVKFAVMGDSGDGSRQQLEVAQEMARVHDVFRFDHVIMLGDNIYGGQSPADLERKFAVPYQPLLDAGVTFQASLGNHDSEHNDQYPPFNMHGQRYYTWAIKNVRFFVLDSNQLDPDQVSWIENALKSAREDWKICYFHHPLYSDGKTHGSEVENRVVLEPIFIKYGVNVVFSGHDHIYERIVPEHGINYFVSGAAGELRKGDLRWTATTAAGFDQDRSFMIVEIAGSALSFQAISRVGDTVDSGVIRLAPRPSPKTGHLGDRR